MQLSKIIRSIARKTRVRHILTVIDFYRVRLVNQVTYGVLSIQRNRHKPANTSLGVSANRRYLIRPDGTPFFWLGDTAWELFHRLNREDATHYLKNRAEKGFSIIQAVVLAELNGLTHPNAYGHLPLIDTNPETPYEPYFNHVDFIVEEANKLGLFIGMLPTWGDKVSAAHGGEPVIFNKTNAFHFGKFLGNRYRNKSIVWILGGDRNPNDRMEQQVWRAMAEGIRAGDHGRHLISYHPRGGATSFNLLDCETLLDFNMYQSGHAQKFNPVYHFAEFLNSVRPVKPFLDAEPGYEDIPVSFWKYLQTKGLGGVPNEVLNADYTIGKPAHFTDGFYSEHHIRVHAYWNLLSGACGHTYGANAIWQMFEKNGPYAIPCLTDWREALDLPGSYSIAQIRKIFQLYPFQEIRPCQDLIVQPNPRDQNHIRAARSNDHAFILVYLSLGQSVNLYLKKVPFHVRWYNPKTGELSGIISTEGPGKATFNAPTSGDNNDWLLVLENSQDGKKTSGV